MNKNLIALMLTSICLMGAVSACKEKPKSDDIIVAKYVPETLKDPIKLPVDTRRSDVQWLGKNYVITIEREPADSLPMLTDETGQQYVDNRVRLTVSRDDNSVFLRKTFTKESFASYIEADFRQKGILENIVFHETDNQQLKFGVVVSRPENDDLFIPLDMWIDRQGGLLIKQGQLFDTTEEEETV